MDNYDEPMSLMHVTDLFINTSASSELTEVVYERWKGSLISLLSSLYSLAPISPA
jgi:hypothetical protein